MKKCDEDNDVHDYGMCNGYHEDSIDEVDDCTPENDALMSFVCP